MTLPVRFPYPPMEAISARALPEGDDWQYEPKWDGFRALIFRDGSAVEIQSKAMKPLTRYFPEVSESALALRPKRFVLDGEIIVPEGRGVSFDLLLQRIHPAESRIVKLAAETPAIYLAFDLLVDDKGKDLTGQPLRIRRTRLEAFAESYLRGSRFLLSPATTKLGDARSWIKKTGNALDGIVAKQVNSVYRSGLREGMEKIKMKRTADCVIGGFRYSTRGSSVGSLLLGLYNQVGDLDYVGHVTVSAEMRDAGLTKKMESMTRPPGFTGRAPGGPSRWAPGRSTEWEPIKPSLVVEVEYDHFTGGRFRHGTKFLRWRPDKNPKSCTLEQVERETGSPLLIVPGGAIPRSRRSPRGGAERSL